MELTEYISEVEGGGDVGPEELEGLTGVKAEIEEVEGELERKEEPRDGGEEEGEEFRP
jgi:hypothetical protein